MHYLHLPLTARLPGLPAGSARQRRGKPSPSSVHQQGLDTESAAAVHQPVVVVTSRMVELLQPRELQAMFIGALSTGLAPGVCSLPHLESVTEVPSPVPTLRLVLATHAHHEVAVFHCPERLRSALFCSQISPAPGDTPSIT